MNDSEPALFQRPVFSSRPNPQSDPKQPLNMTWVPGKTKLSIRRVKARCEMAKGLCHHKARKTLRAAGCSQDTSKSMPQSSPALAHGQVLIKKLLDLCNAHKGNKLSPFHHDHAAGAQGGCAAHFPANNVRQWSLKRWREEKNAAVKSAGMTDYKKWQCEVALTLIKAFWFYLLTAIKTTTPTHCTTSSTVQRANC